MHALVIEDEPLIAMDIEYALRECEFTTFDFAISQDEAVQLARKQCPDLITADVELSPGSGIDAVDAICGGPPIPVIFITGSPDQLGDRVPQHLLLLKPFQNADLIAIAKRAISPGGHERP